MPESPGQGLQIKQRAYNKVHSIMRNKVQKNNPASVVVAQSCKPVLMITVHHHHDIVMLFNHHSQLIYLSLSLSFSL